MSSTCCFTPLIVLHAVHGRYYHRSPKHLYVQQMCVRAPCAWNASLCMCTECVWCRAAVLVSELTVFVNAWPTHANRIACDTTDGQSEDEPEEKPAAERRRSSLSELGSKLTSLILPLKMLVVPRPPAYRSTTFCQSCSTGEEFI